MQRVSVKMERTQDHYIILKCASYSLNIFIIPHKFEKKSTRGRNERVMIIRTAFLQLELPNSALFLVIPARVFKIFLFFFQLQSRTLL